MTTSSPLESSPHLQTRESRFCRGQNRAYTPSFCHTENSGVQRETYILAAFATALSLIFSPYQLTKALFRVTKTAAIVNYLLVRSNFAPVTGGFFFLRSIFYFLALFLKRHAEAFKKCYGILPLLRVGDNSHREPKHVFQFFVRGFRKNVVLFDADGKVAHLVNR